MYYRVDICIIKFRGRRLKMGKKRKEKSFSSFLNNPIDFTLLITIMLLLSIGLIMVLSASSPSALAESGNSYSYFSKQLIFAILGIIAMLFISKIDYRFYQKFYKHAWVISLILLALVLIAGKTVNGAKRWIYVTETLSFQPSELVKLLMIIFYAGILVKNRDELDKYGKGFIKNMCFVILYKRTSIFIIIAKLLKKFSQKTINF